MKIVEIFDSIQGEGEWMGTYCTFIRLPGCNYRCPFCDTVFDKADVEFMYDAQPIQKHVVITGGEPTIHPHIVELCTGLKERGHIVHIETNGTSIGLLPPGVWITCSPKRFEWMKSPTHVVDWLYNLDRVRELKLVVDKDFCADDWVQQCRFTPIWLQPCDGPYLEESKKRIMEIVKQYPDHFKAGIQLHKYYEVI
jgi:organic radical activating enzyme